MWCATASRRPTKLLKNGDIVNIDVAVIKDGWFGDTSRMFCVGEPRLAGTPPGRHHLRGDAGRHRTGQARRHARRCGPCDPERRRSRERFGVVREYCGHGIGQVYHDEPQVLHYGRPGTGLRLEAGMVFTIEPMLNAGKPRNTANCPTAGPS